MNNKAPFKQDLVRRSFDSEFSGFQKIIFIRKVRASRGVSLIRSLLKRRAFDSKLRMIQIIAIPKNFGGANSNAEHSPHLARGPQALVIVFGLKYNFMRDRAATKAEMRRSARRWKDENKLD